MSSIAEKIFKIFSTENASDKFDFYMEDITRILRIYGLNSWQENWKLQEALKSVFPIIILFLYATVFEAYYVKVYFKDADVLLHAFIAASVSDLAMMKLLSIFWNREKLQKLINQIRCDFWKIENDDWVKKQILLKGSKVMRAVIRLYLGQFIFTTILYNTRPIFSAIFFSTRDTPYKIPMIGKVHIDFFIVLIEF